jgi:hypothetical protein
MKFLLIGRDIGFTTPVAPDQLAGLLEGVYLPSFRALEKWEKEGKATGGFFAAQRAGAIILDAASGEELSHKMTELPFWGLLNWEVIPLQSYRSGIEDGERQVAALKQMASMMPKPQH